MPTEYQNLPINKNKHIDNTVLFFKIKETTNIDITLATFLVEITLIHPFCLI